MIFEEQFPVPKYTVASKIGNSVISLLWQLWCRCNPHHNKFSSSSNTTVVAIFPKLCLWRRSLCSNLGGTGPEKLYRATLRQEAKKKFTTRGLFISAISHVKLIAETRLYMPQKHEIYGVFTVLWKFWRKDLYKIFYRKWRTDWVWDSNNYKWLCSTKSLEHLIRSVADKTNAHTPK